MAIEGLAALIKGSIDAATEDGTQVGELVDSDTPEAENVTADDDGTEFVPSANPDEIEGEGDGDAEVVTEEKPVVVEPVVEKDKVVDDGEDAFAKEHGIKSKDAKGRVNRIPYPDVVRINKNAIAKAEKSWQATNGVELQSHKTRNEVYEKRLEQVGKTEEIMFGDAGQFLGMLVASVPGYRELLGDVQLDSRGHVVGMGKTSATAAAEVVAAANANDPEPKPDVNEGGQVGYSPEQHAKLREWDRRQATRDAVAAARAEIDKEYRPIKDVFDNGQKSRAEQARMNATIEAAVKLPGFEANHAAILKAMEDDYQAHVHTDKQYAFKTLEDAYHHVMHTLITQRGETTAQTEARIRKEVNDALARSPRSVNAGGSVVPGAAERGGEAASSGNSTVDAIKASLKKR